jgi:hypothetical protein
MAVQEYGGPNSPRAAVIISCILEQIFPTLEFDWSKNWAGAALFVDMSTRLGTAEFLFQARETLYM